MKRNQSKDFSFENFAASYDSGVAAKGSRKFYNLLLSEFRAQPGAVVLDVGCGTGALLKRLKAKCDIIGYGVDIEENMIGEAKRQCQDMEFSIAECHELPFDAQTFDAVIACMAYHHFRDKEGFAIEAARVLKPGGVLYIVDPRFPWIVRKAMNGILRLIRVVGEFYNPEEIETRFVNAGFIGIGSVVDAYTQVVKLQQKQV